MFEATDEQKKAVLFHTTDWIASGFILIDPIVPNTIFIFVFLFLIFFYPSDKGIITKFSLYRTIWQYYFMVMF